jgi:hypothetical protein
MRFLQVLKPKIYIIQKRCTSVRVGKHQSVGDLAGVGREVVTQFGTRGKRHQESFIVPRELLQKLGSGFARHFKLVSHAVARIENQANGNGRVFPAEGNDRTLFGVLKNSEILFSRPWTLRPKPSVTVTGTRVMSELTRMDRAGSFAGGAFCLRALSSSEPGPVDGPEFPSGESGDVAWQRNIDPKSSRASTVGIRM